MDTDSFIIHMRTEDNYEDIANDVEKWFDTSNYIENDKRLLPLRKYKKEIGLFKDELRGKIMIEFIGLRARTYEKEKKKVKGTKKCVIKQRLLV